MSQVIVCQDNLSPKGTKSSEQERREQTLDFRGKWQKPNLSKLLLIERGFLFLFFPIVLLLAFFLLFLGIASAFFQYFLKIFIGFARFFGMMEKKGSLAS